MILSLRLRANSGLAPSVNLINTSLRSSFPLLVKINIEADRASGLAFKQPVGCLCLLSLRGCPYASNFNAISSHNLWLTVFRVPMTKLYCVQGNPGGGLMSSKCETCFQGASKLSRKIRTCLAQLLCLLTHFVYIDESAGILHSGLHVSSFHRYLIIPEYTFSGISHSRSLGLLRNRKSYCSPCFLLSPCNPHPKEGDSLLRLHSGHHWAVSCMADIRRHIELFTVEKTWPRSFYKY